MDWFLYDRYLRHERVKVKLSFKVTTLIKKQSSVLLTVYNSAFDSSFLIAAGPQYKCMFAFL